MPAATNTNTAASMTAANLAAREVEFVSEFNKTWDALREILGVMRPIRKQPGTVLESVEATVTLANSVAEGEDIGFSKVDYTKSVKEDLTVEKYAIATTIEAVAKYGAKLAVEKAEDAFKDQLTSTVMGRFYTFLQSGTLTSTEASFQMAVAMAIGKVADKFKKLHKGIGDIVVFVNTLDAYRYLGAANLTIQSKFGIQYVEDFMGAKRMILSSDIDEGKVIATPVNNIDLYYIDPNDSDFVQLGLEFTVEGETNLIGYHLEGNYKNATGEGYALMGMKLFAEYIDGIAVVTIGDEPDTTLSALAVGSLTLTPTFDADVTEYAATTENATNTVTATATDSNATVELYLGETKQTGTTITWASGENVLKVVVTNGTATKTYTVTVTKS